jgi:hypothetical protein
LITLNGMRGLHAQMRMPKHGAWSVDVDIDLALLPIVPSGRSALTLGTSLLSGTVDARASGRFGAKASVRVAGGGGGWDTPVPALSLDNDAGVFSSEVYAVTGASVGEVVLELGPPRLLGAHYARMRGAAAQVFEGVEWWVDLLGITNVGPRLPMPAPLSAQITAWDPKACVAQIASDELIVPGMLLVDSRFDAAVVDDVEQVFDDGGARAIAWCSAVTASVAEAALAAPPAPGSLLVKAIAAMAQGAGAALLKQYSYRVVVQGVDGRLNLQATTLDGDAPMFLKLVDVWPGVPGVTMKLAPASVVRVIFLEGDRGRPQVVGFDPSSPPVLELDFDVVKFTVGAGSAPVVRLTASLVTWLTAVGTGSGAGAPPVLDITSTALFTD